MTSNLEELTADLARLRVMLEQLKPELDALKEIQELMDPETLKALRVLRKMMVTKHNFKVFVNDRIPG